MVKVRALAPIEDEEGTIAVDEVVDVSVEQAEAWRAQGKVSLLTTEQANAEQAGVYNAVTGRDDVAGTPGGQQLPGPQSDEPPPKKGKK